MTKHKMQLTFDEDSDVLTVTHRTTVQIGENSVSHAEMVELVNRDAVVSTLKAFIDGNRKEMDKRATEQAIIHVAAVSDKSKAKHQLSVGGDVGAISASTTEKLP